MQNTGPNLIGSQLGSCVLTRLIGSGGMGMVFLARQAHLERDVAVKVLRQDTGYSPESEQEFLARFRREANVIARLDQVNILPLYEYGEQNGLAYLVMPYLAGGSLKDLLIRRGDRLSPQEVLPYIEQASAALQYAHEHKVIHRDIKPGNILFHSDGRLVLADFGLARIMHDSTETQTGLTSPENFLGSVEYMAPEMVSGQPIDQRTDIYELGVVLFQMLAGRVPFQGETPLAVAMQHLNETPPSVLLINPSIAPMIDAVVQRAMAKEPARRYSTAKEFAQALRTAVEKSNISAPYPLTESFTTMAENSGQKAGRPIPPSPWSSPPVGSNFSQDTVFPANTIKPAQTPLPPVYAGTNNSIYNTTPFGPSPEQRVSTPAPGGIPVWLIWLISLCIIAGLIVTAVLFAPTILKTLGGSVAVSPTATSIAVTATPAATATTPTSATPTPTSTDPALQAQSIVENYYSYINQNDYHSAYLLWGMNYQQQQTYTQFATGFANTQKDDLKINSVSAANGGQYTVKVTITATEKSGATTKQTIYTGEYTVGIENGDLKLLTGQLQPAS